MDWDAAAYDDLADVPHDAWAEQVLSRLELEGDETVLDAGCGTGRMIALLRERHPGLTLIGVDGFAGDARARAGESRRRRRADRVETCSSSSSTSRWT